MNCCLRGGSAWNDPRNLRSANRNRNEPGNRNENIGFRCVRAPAANTPLSAPCSVRLERCSKPECARSSRHFSRPSGRIFSNTNSASGVT